jgi:hypothetical protein
MTSCGYFVTLDVGIMNNFCFLTQYGLVIHNQHIVGLVLFTGYAQDIKLAMLLMFVPKRESHGSTIHHVGVVR